ncbi:MAG: DUF2069 domain-containing protein [Gammaproteobacteria bacterium]|nr:DUF2069 domain-containing protein [Gammaproteobacteria bacterium]MBQ0838891.1 DUF2069 domain-containing protein [Gammaproteobacteria bacterium]
MSDLSQLITKARVITRLSYCLLIVSLIGGGLVSGTPAILLLFAVAPLLIFIPGLRKENYRSISMLCFVTLLYFTVIVANLFEPDRSAFDVSAVIAVVTLFIVSMMYSRWLQRQQAKPAIDYSQEC